MTRNNTSWNIFRAYGFLWVTGLLFILALGGHWAFAWFAYVSEQTQHGAPIELSGYVVEVARDTLENWQSEFLQLVWQVAGLSFLFHLRSPQSKEGDDRKEEKLDEILRIIDSKKAPDIIARLDQKFPR